LCWQTYDYYFDVSAGYFGSKKGSEPLHIQWNPLTDTVEVVNYNAGNVRGLSAHAELLDMSGARKWEKAATLDSNEDSIESPIKLEFLPILTSVHFIRLTLTRGSEPVSDNFYLRGLEETPAPASAGPGRPPAARAAARWATTSKPFAACPRSKWKPPPKSRGKAAAGRWRPSCATHPPSRP